MTDLDHASLDRVLPSAPGSADWDDVLSRSRSGHGHRRRRLVVLAVAALRPGTTSAFAMPADRGPSACPAGATPTPEGGAVASTGSSR
jgi:hypothetical protein